MDTPGAIADFPIPADIEGYWERGEIAASRPQTPLGQEISVAAIQEGLSRAMDAFGALVETVWRPINYYMYSSTRPCDLHGESFDDRRRRYGATLDQIAPNIGPLWERDWLPSILPGLDKARALDFAAMTDERLLDALDELRRDHVERSIVHGKLNFVLVPASRFADFYIETFHPDDPIEPYSLLQGFPTRSVDAGRGLWRLSRSIKDDPALSGLFRQFDADALWARLPQSDAGRTFLAGFDVYLDEFGWRSDTFELADPTWREQPRIPLSMLRGYVELGDEGDPDTRFREAVRRREALLSQTRARLAARPDALARFEELYEQARWYLPVIENHNHYIDQMGTAVLRIPILEMGRRLAGRERIADPDDIFFLYVREIRDGMAGADQRPLTALRKAEMERWSNVTPPAFIGQPLSRDQWPHGDSFLAAMAGDPFSHAVVKMLGSPLEPSGDPAVITGIPASPGVARGRAKVVRRLEEAGKLEPGDILVCELTMPPWTPLFSTVGAVVADSGGVLSHCAIVAREYGVPCVVRTKHGTSLIEDGMLLTVDGSKGIVRIETAPEMP